jgi:tetratricopeptide (TPR) repeat protein
MLACAAVYANSLAVPFIFDDRSAIVENPTIRSLSRMRRVLFPPQEGETVQGRPLVNLTFALNYAWTKDAVWSWHVVNIAIHALAGIFLFGVARQTLRSPVFDDRLRQQASFLAFAIAMLWTLHPLQTESVTYIVQRAESLVGLMFLVTLYCSIRAAKSPPGRGWQVAAVLACGIGMATKEVMVAAPILVVLYDWTFSKQTLQSVLRQRRGFYLLLAGTWLVLAGLLVGSHDRGGSAGLGLGVTSWEYARTQFGFIVHYLRLAFWPHGLVLDYGNRIATQAGEIVLPGLIVLALAGATLAALWRPEWRPWGFLGAWFFLILAPSSSVIPVVTQTGAEHRMYLPLAAVVAATVMAADRILKRPAAQTDRVASDVPDASLSLFPGLAGALLFGIVVLILGFVTARRNVDYRSVLAIWTDVAEKCPENYRAFSFLGEEAVAAGELLRGVEYFDESIRLNPAAKDTYNQRGGAHMQLGNIDQAQSDFERARDIIPRRAVVHFDRGITRAGQGDLEGALAAFTEAAKRAPLSAPVRFRKGAVLADLGRHAEAIEAFSEALQLNSGLAEAYRARALAHLRLRQFDSARDDLAELERLGVPVDAELTEQIGSQSQSDASNH